MRCEFSILYAAPVMVFMERGGDWQERFSSLCAFLHLLRMYKNNCLLIFLHLLFLKHCIGGAAKRAAQVLSKYKKTKK